MTVIAAPFPRARSAAPASLADRLAFAAAVFIVLTYSQGWILPLIGGGDETSDSGLIRTLYLPAYVAAVGLLAMSPAATLKGLVRQPTLVLLIGVACASLFWSVSPDQTERRIFALIFTTLGGVVLAARFSWARLAEVLAMAFAILAAASLFTGLFVPSIGRMDNLFPGAWRGLWPEKNALGGNMALGAAICTAAALLNPRHARLWWGAAVLSCLLLVMSTSKTSVVSLSAGVAAMGLVALARRGPAGAVAATWLAVAGLAAAGAAAFFASDLVLGLLGKDATLTGRTQIWSAVLRQIHQRPWLGYGYAAIWDEDLGSWGPLSWIIHDAGFRPHHAHNSWLEQWLALGYVGLAAWTGFFVQTLAANVVALYRSQGAYLALPFFVVYALTTLSESIVLQYNDMRWMIFVALAVKLALPDPKSVRAAPTPRLVSWAGAERTPSRSPSSP